MNAIGEKVLLTSGSITIAVQPEGKGLVRRERRTTDARVVQHLTEAGRELIESAFVAHSANLDHLFEVFTEGHAQLPIWCAATRMPRVRNDPLKKLIKKSASIA